jgi:hypothetical protein
MSKSYINIIITESSLVVFNKYGQRKQKKKDEEDSLIVIPISSIIGFIPYPFTSTFNHSVFQHCSFNPLYCFSFVRKDRTYDFIASSKTDLNNIYLMSCRNVRFPLINSIVNNERKNINQIGEKDLLKYFKDIWEYNKIKCNLYPKYSQENLYQWFNRLIRTSVDIVIRNPNGQYHYAQKN